MKFWNKYLPNFSKEEQDRLYEKYIHEAGDAELYPKVLETLQSLDKKGYKIFVVSSDPLSKLASEIENSGLKNMIKKTIGAVHKKENSLISIMEEFSLDSENTYYIGDTAGDIEAGKIANVKTIGISRGFQDRNLLAKSEPDFIIDDIVEIKEILT